MGCVLQLETVSDALRSIQQRLCGYSPTPRLDAEVFLAEVLEQNRAFLYAHGEHLMPDALKQRLTDWVLSRVQGKPVAYILKKREFWGLTLTVNQHCLIPRPDTETLVESALACLAQLRKDSPDLKQAWVVDAGTGSGAIGLALTCECDWIQCLGVDNSTAALAVAARNYAAFGDQRCFAMRGDWLSALDKHAVHLVVSNPPYIAAHDVHLTQGDVRFEPTQALVGGATGVERYYRLIPQALRVLKPWGFLVLEHSFDQGDQVRAIMRQNQFHHIQTQLDLAGHERVTSGMKPGC